MEYTIRPVDSAEEYHACERLQQAAWGFEDKLDVIPLTQMITAQKYGGVVLGAFTSRGELHGFCYGFLGRDRRGRWVLCSHMLAVDKSVRSHGLGARLKWAQREHALDLGLDLMVWTYDPLESVNACLNFGKLGGVSDEYLSDLYGPTTSELHSGTATDRLTLKWFLRSQRVISRRQGELGELAEALRRGEVEAPWVLETQRRKVGVAPTEPVLAAGAPRVRCEIPTEIQAVKQVDPGVAVAWRDAVRAVFTAYFDTGYYARECIRTREDPARTVYLLERGSCEPGGTEE